VAFVLDVLAGVAVAEGEPERAATLFGAAESRWRVLGVGPSRLPALATLHEDGVIRVREALGERAYQARCRAGGEMPPDDAVRFALGETEPAPRGDEDESPLTTRELEVAELVARGLSNRDVAQVLYISPRTAQGHVENILRKLDFSSRTQVAAWVVERNARAERRR
jgi:non-specific serine/threonine protein kinase